MTYESSASKGRFTGNGVATAFPTPFTFVANGHVKCVFSVGNSTGGYDETPLEEGVDYSLTGAGNENGGTITFPLPGSAYAVLGSSQFLTCYLKPPIAQSTNLSNSGSIDLEVHEAAFDLLTMICQSLQEQVDRAVMYPVSADQSNILDSASFLDATMENKTAAAASVLAASTSADHAATSESNAAASALAASTSADAAAASAAEASETISSGLPDATTTTKGKVRFATASEVASGTAGGAVSPADLGSAALLDAENIPNTNTVVSKTSDTGAAIMPAGTTLQRPGVPQDGMFRLNTTTRTPEWYDEAHSIWVPYFKSQTYSVDYLLLGGGGGGSAGGNGGGGGGGGGKREGAAAVTVGVDYTITIGAGGAGSTTNGVIGSDTVFSDITALGGGAAKAAANSAPGGCGGGASGAPSGYTPGAGTSGQGFSGGTALTSSPYPSGGGGGTETAGVHGSGSQSGAGGLGASSSITGTATRRGAGGGAGPTTQGAARGLGGLGGGGDGAATPTGAASSGTANSGSGGGGGGNGSGSTSGPGGSGIAIISYPGAQRATGGTVTSVGGYTIHTFTSSGTFTA